MTIAGPFFMFPDVDLLAPNAVSRVDVTRLANGGFAVIGDQSGHINGAIYDAAGNIIQNFSDVLGTDGAIAQLSGDRLVIVSETASSVQFEILDAVTGAQVLATTTANSGVGQNADAATLPGGSFVLAYQAAGVGTDSNIQLEFWTSAGVYQQTVFVDTSLAADTDVSVAALADGRIAVAWTRTDSIGETDLWFAIYAADGTEVKSPALLDGAFDVNRNASVAASGDGFAIAYETRALAPFPSARIDIFLRQFNSSGIEQSNTRVTNTAFDDTGIMDNLDHTDPYLAYAPDGNLAVGYTDELGDTHFAIVKDAAVISEIQTGAGNSNQQSNTAVAFFGVGQLASFHADDILGVRGEHWYGSRDVVGEDFGEIYQGDDFVDIINGRGGDDTLDGGGGNDEVKGDDGFDIVRGGEGDDMVDGAGDTGDDGSADELYGDAGSDRLLGGGGADRLDGGAGDDKMFGGDDDDTYIVDSILDQVIETAGGGTDTVESSVTFSLGAEQENLALTGAAAINAFGNGLDNRLTGNEAANVLNGLAGADIMRGLAGDDRYVVDNALDQVIEAAGGGADRVLSSVNFSLGAGQEIELLATTNAAGIGAINLRGNAFGQTIQGNNGANVLNGGLGNDTLFGLGGGGHFRVQHGAERSVQSGYDR